jgi:adenylate cyclase
MRVNPSKRRIRRRDLRMISGIVMLCHLASHLANHALGLVSLNAAEIVLSGTVQFC